MDRRTVLLGLMGIAASQVACQRTADQTLRIVTLKRALPPRLVATFKETQKVAQSASLNLKIDTETSVANLFHQLQQWRIGEEAPRNWWPLNYFSRSQSPAIANWVSLSDYWLTAAIQQDLILPLVATAIPSWSDLPEIWQSHLQRDRQGLPSEQGPPWATPYRWGSLMIVYSRQHLNRISWQPTQWRDLWNPKLEKRVALPNHPRLVLGLVLKSLGNSINVADPDAQTEFTEALAALRPQVKVYDSDNYLQPLIQGDTWVAVGWSTDIRPALSQYRQLAAFVPDPGTILSADVWVKPRTKASSSGVANLTAMDKAWLSYWWQSETATPFSLFSDGLSPLLITPPVSTETDTDLSSEKVLLPTAGQLEQSEFIKPLSPAGVESYTKLWRNLRGGE
ncbi:MAG: extracellular solute-binding protein [Cyanobacteria bacterium J06626_18]